MIDSSTDEGCTENLRPASLSIVFLLSEPDASIKSSTGTIIGFI